MSSSNEVARGKGESDFLAALDELVAVRRQISMAEAREAELYAQCADYAERRMDELASRSSREREIPWRSVALELAAATNMSDRTTRYRMDEARTLRAQFPHTLAAWSRGDISRGHVRVIVEAGWQISTPQAREEFEQRLIPIACEESPGRTRPIARVMATRIEPAVAAARLEKAPADRSVRVNDLDDGLSELIAILPTVLAHGIQDRLSQTARAVRRAERESTQALATGEHTDAQDASSERVEAPSLNTQHIDEPSTGGGALDRSPAPLLRTTDQIRADLLCDLLLSAAPSPEQVPVIGRDGADLGAITGQVLVVVAESTLAGEDDAPALLSGAGAIPADHARSIASRLPGWDRVTIDPTNGTLVRVDRYRPSREQVRFLQARDEHCRAPGCTRPARYCDLDHSHDWALGGDTSTANLGDKCKAHHMVKHGGRWTISQRPDGTLLWQSPTGRTYPDVPRPAVAFMVSGPPSGTPEEDAPF